MKATVYILTFVMAFLTVQPLMPLNNKQTENCCTEQYCKKKEKKKNTGNKDCNPLMNCSSCALFIVSKSYLKEITAHNNKEKIFIKNDNRTVKNLTEFWHPPEYEA